MEKSQTPRFFIANEKLCLPKDKTKQLKSFTTRTKYRQTTAAVNETNIKYCTRSKLPSNSTTNPKRQALPILSLPLSTKQQLEANYKTKVDEKASQKTYTLTHRSILSTLSQPDPKHQKLNKYHDVL